MVTYVVNSCASRVLVSSRGSSGAPGKQHRYNKDHCDSRSSSTKELKDDAQGTAVAVQDNGHRQPLEACNLSNGTLPKQQQLLLLLLNKSTRNRQATDTKLFKPLTSGMTRCTPTAETALQLLHETDVTACQKNAIRSINLGMTPNKDSRGRPKPQRKPKPTRPKPETSNPNLKPPGQGQLWRSLSQSPGGVPKLTARGIRLRSGFRLLLKVSGHRAH